MDSKFCLSSGCLSAPEPLGPDLETSSYAQAGWCTFGTYCFLSLGHWWLHLIVLLSVYENKFTVLISLSNILATGLQSNQEEGLVTCYTQHCLCVGRCVYNSRKQWWCWQEATHKEGRKHRVPFLDLLVINIKQWIKGLEIFLLEFLVKFCIYRQNSILALFFQLITEWPAKRDPVHLLMDRSKT